MATYTTDWQILDPKMRVQAISATSTAKNLPLGTRVKAVDRGSANNLAGNGEGEFIYAVGVASTAVGDWVVIESDGYATTRLNADKIGMVGVAMSANVANQYGWYQIYGKAVANALAGFADNGRVYGTSTAGSVDDTAVAGDGVWHARGASALDAPATGMAEFEIFYPFVDDGQTY